MDMDRRGFEPRNLNQDSINVKIFSSVLKCIPGARLNPNRSIQLCSEEHSELKHGGGQP